MHKTEIKKKLIIMGILTLFISSFVKSSLNLALPNIANDLNLSTVFLTWIPTLYLTITAILYIPFGRIGDIYGRKRMFLYGLVIFTISSFLCSFSISGEMLLIIRIFQAIGNAMMFANLYALISSLFTFFERGRAFGIVIMGFLVGLVLGPTLGGFITQMIGWRYIFLFDAFIGVLITLVVIKFKYEWKEADGEKLDVFGSFILGLSLILILYGFSRFNNVNNVFIIIMGIIGLLMFYLIEKRSDFPLLNMKLIKNKSFTFGNITSIITYSAFIAVYYLLNLYLCYIKGFEPIKSGLILSLLAVVMLFISPFAGKLSDKIHPERVSTAGMIFTTIGLAIMALIIENNNLKPLLLSVIFIGIGIGLFLPSNTKSVLSSVKSKYYGVAGATLNSMRSMGQVLGMEITLIIISIFLGDVSIAPSNNPELLISIKVSLIILTLLCAIGIIISLIRDKKN